MAIPTTHERQHALDDPLDHTGTLPPAMIDLAADYTWTGLHTFDGDIVIGDGRKYTSEEADSALGVAHRFGTDNTLTESFTSTSGFPTDARYLCQWYNGDPATANNYRMRLFANGVLQPRTGLYIGLTPYDSVVDQTTMYLLRTTSQTTPGFQAGNYVLQTQASASRGVRAVGLQCDVRVQDTYLGALNGAISGGKFVVNIQTAGARTYGGNLAGGEFGFAFNQAIDYSGLGFSTAYAGQFFLEDKDTATPTYKYCFTGGFIRLRYDTWNDKIRYQKFQGIDMPDCTQTNFYGTVEHDAIKIAEGARKTGALQQNVRFVGGNWDTGHLQIGNTHIWSNGSTLYGKVGAPVSATDGSDLTAGGGGAAADSFLEWAGL